MKNHFASYIKTDFDGDSSAFVVDLEDFIRESGVDYWIFGHTHWNAKRGTRYIMVDLAPTDNSNSECEYDGQHVCWITSVDGDDEGSVYEKFTNYMDACRWLADFIRQGDFQEIYIETY